MAEAQLQQFLRKVDQLQRFVSLTEAEPGLRAALSDCNCHQQVVELARSRGFEIGRRWGEEAGSAGGDSSYSSGPTFPGSSGDAPRPHRRGRVQSADFGMPERQGLLDLARTYLEVQARLWPDLAGTAAVPALAVLDRGRSGETDGTSWPAACSEQPDGLAGKATPKEVVVPLKRKCHRAGGDPSVTPAADSQPPKA